VRAKRALAAEVFTLDVQDSVGGRLAATRYPSASAKLGTTAACRVHLALALDGDASRTQLAATSRWIAPERTTETNGSVCEGERQATLERIQQVISPPQQ
jgi:hypothetical protein